MIDLHGPSCSGKTLLLYAIIIATILPRSWKYSKSSPAFLLCGNARSVIFMDLERGFSRDRLLSLLRLEVIARLKSPRRDWASRVEEDSEGQEYGPLPSREADLPTGELHADMDINSHAMQAKIEQLVLSCLRNVHIFRPPDAVSAIAMLRTMDRYLDLNTSNPSNSTSTITATAGAAALSPPATLLMIDSLSTFYWQERAQSSHTRFMTVLIDALNRLTARRKLVFISTTWSLPSSNAKTDRTLTDALRGRLRYRFLMQPRILERFETEEDLVREWSARQELDKDMTGAYDDGSLFQAQMIIPSVDSRHQELFRISVSNVAGVSTFSVPPFS
ncbi:hypothetical protein BGZ99_005874 [Dissophora globulifera]|uniref:DNA recombination and repair protein Rad51-like C-terminal domain-containing protein n=1 Tax=Dissophora globulifera TaxID=979702 RepID=A0A9P6UZW3_9FUNG|nr:hypothetical protein BGZ99_005874 [Dissophora globulifera]